MALTQIQTASIAANAITAAKIADGTVVAADIADGAVTGAKLASDFAISVNTSNTALRITQTGAGNALLVEDSSNPDSTPFVVDANGKVVVGGTSSIISRQVEIQETGATPLGLLTTSDTASSGVNIDLCRKRTTGGLVQNNDLVSSIRNFAHDGTNYVETSRIKFEVDGTPDTNDMPGRLVFSTTADGASSPTERVRISATGTTKFSYGIQEKKVAIAASDIDLNSGNYFTKTISGATTFTVSNVASSGAVTSLVLDLTDGGSDTVTWWSGITWNAATPPTLTASGVDTLAFFTYDGGTTWRGFVLGQAMAAAA